MTTPDYEWMAQGDYITLRAWCMRERRSLSTVRRWIRACKILFERDHGGRYWILASETAFAVEQTHAMEGTIADHDLRVLIREDKTRSDIPPAIRQERARVESMRWRDLLTAQGKTYPNYGPTVRHLGDDMDLAV